MASFNSITCSKTLPPKAGPLGGAGGRASTHASEGQNLGITPARDTAALCVKVTDQHPPWLWG